MNKKVLITAGPTYEPIDPVRYIGNHSSGKMGYAIAEAFASLGAQVTLVSGPTALKTRLDGIDVISVQTAKEMYEASKNAAEEVDIAVFTAAVADFTPEKVDDQKIKRGKDDMVIRLKPTSDIAGTLGKTKRDDQFFVGFALETSNGVENAKSKLSRKNMDMIVLNSLQDPGAGFGTDTNRVSIIDKSGNIAAFDLKQKEEVAKDIVSQIIKRRSDA